MSRVTVTSRMYIRKYNTYMNIQKSKHIITRKQNHSGVYGV